MLAYFVLSFCSHFVEEKALLEYQVLDTLILHNILSEVELIDLSNLMSDYSFLICTQSVPNIDSQSLY
jgi:hypothetical protein